jgi:hypothetical protein
MDIGVALAVLGFSRYSVLDAEIIKKAWKARIAKVHPDKNSSPGALKSSQMLNEAKDVLMGTLDVLFESKQMQAEEEERLAKQKEKEDAHQAFLRKFEQDCDAHWEKVRAFKRANYARNRKPRAAGSRIHKKIEDYQEGKALINRIKDFFAKCFEEKSGAHTLCSELLDCFVKSNVEEDKEKDKATATLEQRLFVRHAKRLFLAQWPRAKYTLYKNQRCYLNVALKN